MQTHQQDEENVPRYDRRVWKHALNCQYGGRRIHLRDNICDVLADAHRDLHMHSIREVIVHALSNKKLEHPRIDLDISVNQQMFRTLLDLCIHDPPPGLTLAPAGRTQACNVQA